MSAATSATAIRMAPSRPPAVAARRRGKRDLEQDGGQSRAIPLKTFRSGFATPFSSSNPDVPHHLQMLSVPSRHWYQTSRPISKRCRTWSVILKVRRRLCRCRAAETINGFLSPLPVPQPISVTQIGVLREPRLVEHLAGQPELLLDVPDGPAVGVDRDDVGRPLGRLRLEHPLQVGDAVDRLRVLRGRDDAAGDEQRVRVLRVDRVGRDRQQSPVLTGLRLALPVAERVLLVPDLPFLDRPIGDRGVERPELAVRAVAVDDGRQEGAPFRLRVAEGNGVRLRRDVAGNAVQDRQQVDPVARGPGDDRVEMPPVVGVVRMRLDAGDVEPGAEQPDVSGLHLGVVDVAVDESWMDAEEALRSLGGKRGVGGAQRHDRCQQRERRRYAAQAPGHHLHPSCRRRGHEAGKGTDSTGAPIRFTAGGRTGTQCSSTSPRNCFVRSSRGFVEHLRGRALLDDRALVHEDRPGRRPRGRSRSRG